MLELHYCYWHLLTAIYWYIMIKIYNDIYNVKDFKLSRISEIIHTVSHDILLCWNLLDRKQEELNSYLCMKKIDSFKT